MLIERNRYIQREEKFSMSELLQAHNISAKWTKQIDRAVNYFAKQKRSGEVPMEEFFLKVREFYELDHPTEEVNVPAPTKEVRENPLEKASLEDLIKEINRRGFKVAQV